MQGPMELAAHGGRRVWLKYLAGFLLLSGCGGAEEVVNPVADMTDDQKAINNVVSSVSDLAAASLKQLRTAFTKEGAPKSSDVEKYKKHYVQLDGEIVVSGDTATVPVQIGEYGSDTTTGATWKAAKEEGRWKMAEAPLP